MGSALYLRNCWYGLAWAEELLATPLLARRILGMDMVVFRDAKGRPTALRDRCPHRFAPLSRGVLKDGTVQCSYHGLRFDGAGGCVENPFGRVPPRAAVEKFTVVERDQMLWIWPGDAAKATPDTIPDFSFQNRDGIDGDWVVFGYTHVQANYQLETDNLLDLSHTEFLHANSFGGRGLIQRGEYQLRDLNTEIHSNWWMANIPFINPMTRQPTGERLDHFLDMRWTAPSAMRLHVSFLPHGVHADRKDNRRDDLPGQFSAHIITPQDIGSCHYFWSANKPTGAGPFVGGVDKTKGLALFKQAFEIEDKPMIEAVEANMAADFWDERPLLLANDAGGVRARRRLAKLIQEEQAAAETADA
ncbi:phenylpropionate dioxygenase-like ring-hydroxylating dioxygenase large terminal subunit [Beijerinckia sp. GAS462]|nr:phenylpropionate dioxygenase-like ring-hydroxylating dioxygenase large terminal subunit [Beijerinckia sp. GAS462]SEB51460.1 vanillate O-demethylase monooxygenase subunit [Beijerinckia sp. 28-YEA-48]